MKAKTGKLAVSVLTLAVQGAFASMAALPVSAVAQDEEDAAALTNPTNYVEIGVSNTDKSSAKFGEYNGLNKSGVDLIGNFDVKGGDAYGAGDGTMRWGVNGTDLGTTSRELGASAGRQGKWSLGISYDQLRHNLTDSYQTPYQGTMGGNGFLLPNSFGVINTSQTPATSAGALGLTAGQRAAFQTQDVYSQREKTSFSGSYDFDAHWGVKLDYSRLDQSGAKLIGSATDPLAFIGSSAANWGAERVAILMNPTNYKTDTFNLAVNWTGEKAHFSAEYYGSLFHDDYSGLSWSSPWVANQTANASRGLVAWTAPATGTNLGAFPVDTMSTPPSNQFHQFNLKGGYNFSGSTRLAGGLSYARNTQNDSFSGTYTPGTLTLLPVNSLDGLVVMTHGDLKLTHQATKALDVSAAVKYDERDNRTASNVYNFYAPNGASNAPLGNAPFAVTNIPMSNKHYQVELAGDYRIDPRQRLHVGYEYEKVERWCNNSLANNARGVTTAYYTTASCVQVPKNEDNKLVLGYKLRASEAVSLNAGYTYDKRTADVSSSFYNPLQASSEGYEVPGYLAFFDASRTEDLFKLGVNWQATPRLNFGLNGKYAKDDYDTTLGVQKGETWSANLDASYSFSAKNTVAAFATVQKRKRDLTSGYERSATVAPTQIWTNNLSEDDLTVGVSAKQKELMGGKLELAEDITYSLGKTDYFSTQIAGAAITNCGNGTGALCGPMPTIRNELTQFRFSAGYKLDKASKIMAGYLYQRLKTDDYYYSIYQLGYTGSTVLPTNQQPGSYNQNLVYVAYRYSFR